MVFVWEWAALSTAVGSPLSVSVKSPCRLPGVGRCLDGVVAGGERHLYARVVVASTRVDVVVLRHGVSIAVKQEEIRVRFRLQRNRLHQTAL